MPFLSDAEISKLGLKKVGKGVRISSLASIDKPEQIEIGDYSRIDDFCALSGNIKIGRNVHIAIHSAVIASQEPIVISDFAGLAFGCLLFSSSDDYSGESLTNPTVPVEFKKIAHGSISLGRHVILGARTVVMPGVNIGEGSATGAGTLLNKSVDGWGIYIGAPGRKVKDRSKTLLSLELDFLSKI